MATFTIISTADSVTDTGIGAVDANGNSSGTLREAINFANQNVANPGTVTNLVVATNLAGGKITLAGNLPLVATSVNLNGGAGSTTGQVLTINGGGTYRGLLISGMPPTGRTPQRRRSTSATSISRTLLPRAATVPTAAAAVWAPAARCSSAQRPTSR